MTMTFSVTIGAECNQILHYIPAESASRLDVVNLQVFHSTAVLAPPTISFQHLFANHGVFFRAQFDSGSPMAHAVSLWVHNESYG
jgi:hypothetical protein